MWGFHGRAGGGTSQFTREGGRLAVKKGSKKKPDVSMMPESDETFAYIAGYTSGGVPYGVTWEESEALDASQREKKRECLVQAPPPTG